MTSGIFIAALFGSVVDLVDPFIGTAANGHTFPGATVPFGMVQPSPDTGNGDWGHCGGYRYEDEQVLGFSQTHLSGTGRGELGDVLLLPFAGPGTLRSSRHDKSVERAHPGYYTTTLTDASVSVELTASERVAFHRYVYAGEGGRLLVDLQHGITSVRSLIPSQILEQAVVLCPDGTGLSGSTRRKCNWSDHRYHFALRFDRKWRSAVRLPPDDPAERGGRYVFDFGLSKGDVLQVKVAFSTTSPRAAERNLESEVPDWDFDRVRRAASSTWESQLGRIAIESDATVATNFYTALYHSCVAPNVISDVGEPPRYSTLSLWDTFRAVHPLFTFIAFERVEDFVNTCLDSYETNGFLLVWGGIWGIDGKSNMIGNHSVQVIAEAYAKGFRGFNVRRAQLAINDSLRRNWPERPKDQWDLLDRFGYYPCDRISRESVSRTLECAHDAASAAAFLRASGGSPNDVAFYCRRAGAWTNVFDRSVGFMRGRRADGSFVKPFDPINARATSVPPRPDYTEGNAWQWSWHVPHDVPALIAAYGGADGFIRRLDELFTTSLPPSAWLGQDVTGLIGQYAHGNEPCHHVPYLYALAGDPEKTRRCVARILRTLYHPAPDGLCGNDDCGQMSAWYVLSALGFYPVDTVTGDYVVGGSLVRSAVLRLPSGREFRIRADPASVPPLILHHADIVAGGSIALPPLSH